MKLHRWLSTLLMTATVMLTLSARAEDAAEDNLANYLQMLRSDVSAAKVEAINDALKLSEAEGGKFWPVYREYDFKLAKLSDVKVALIRDFITAQTGGTLDDARAGEIASRWLDYQAERLALWREFHGRIQGELGAVRAAQFLQAEHQLALFIDLAIASEMPAVGEPRQVEDVPPIAAGEPPASDL